MKHHHQNNLKRKGVSSPYNSQVTSIAGEVRARTQGRNWGRSHGGVLLSGLLPRAYLPSFLMEPRTPSREWHDSQWIGLSRICPTGHLGKDISPVEAPDSQITPACVKMTRNQAVPTGHSEVSHPPWEYRHSSHVFYISAHTYSLKSFSYNARWVL